MGLNLSKLILPFFLGMILLSFTILFPFYIGQNEPKSSQKKEVHPIKEKIVTKKFLEADRKVVYTNNSTKKVLNNLRFKNHYNPKWKELLKEELSSGEGKQGELSINTYPGELHIKEDKAYYLEKVKIEVQLPHREDEKFFAYVDSSSGEIIHTWALNLGPYPEGEIKRVEF